MFLRSLLLILTTLVFGITSVFAATKTLDQKDLRTHVGELMPQVESQGKISYVTVAKQAQRWIFIAVGIIAVAFIVLIGSQLVFAKWSTEELTSAIKAFSFIILGLAIIPFAYFLVQLIVNLRLGR